MATFNLDLNNENYAAEVLSYYLWGQREAPNPNEMTSNRWIDRAEEVIVKIDPKQYAEKYGHLYIPKDFKLIEVFFSGKDRKGGTLDPGRISSYARDSEGN